MSTKQVWCVAITIVATNVCGLTVMDNSLSGCVQRADAVLQGTVTSVSVTNHGALGAKANHLKVLYGIQVDCVFWPTNVTLTRTQLEELATPAQAETVQSDIGLKAVFVLYSIERVHTVTNGFRSTLVKGCVPLRHAVRQKTVLDLSETGVVATILQNRKGIVVDQVAMPTERFFEDWHTFTNRNRLWDMPTPIELR